MSETRETCETCRFWDKREPGHTYADCHRQPPQFSFNVMVRRDRYGKDQDEITVARFPNGSWPNVAHDDWCGEHSPAKQEDARE